MMTFVAVIHILIAYLLITLVLIQDSKGGGALGIGAGSNSLLGATGAQTLAARATRWVAALFAITCLSLTMLTAQRSRSVLDGAVLPTAPATAPAAAGAAPVDAAAAPGAAPETAAPTAPDATAPAAAPAAAPAENNTK